MDNVDISVIIPVFNGEKYLEECLDSALSQTIENKEIICVDDGSTDTTHEILRNFAEKHDMINLLTQENSGSGVARNNALLYAKGRYVCFLDSDDHYIDQDALDTMVRICDNKVLSVCGSLRRYIDPHTGEENPHPLHREFIKEHPEGGLIKFIDYQDDYHFQSYVIKRRLIEENNIQFPPYRRYQDPPFFLKVMLAAEEFWVSPKELYCYRRNSKTTLASKMVIEDLAKGLNDNLRMSEKNGLEKLKSRIEKRINVDFKRELESIKE